MSDNLKITKMTLLMELIPFFIQLIGIITLLYVAFSNQFYSLSAIILSIIWLKLSRSEMPDEFGRMRMQRRLFEKLGNWLEQPTATEDYDKAQEDTLLIDGSLEEDRYKELISAAGIVNFARSTASVFLCIYLLYIASQVFIFI